MWEQLNALFLRLQADARRRRRGRARTHYVVARDHRRRAPLQGHHRRDDGARRRVAVPAGRPLPRARRRDGGAARRSSSPTDRCRRHAGRSIRSNGSGCCARARRSKRYCRYYTADVRPERIAEFLLLNAEFPRSVRFAAARVEVGAPRHRAATAAARAGGRAERLAGRLHASLDYGQVDEILSDDPHDVSRRHRPLVRADPRGAVPELHRVPDRVGAARVTA